MGNSIHLPSDSFTPPAPATVLSPEQQSELATFTCEICIEPTLSPEQRFKNKDLCTHPFCKDCITKYIQVKVEDDNIASIKCPGLCCDYDLDPLSCRLILPIKLFEKWCDFLCKDTILGLNHCYCPNQQCSALVVNECGRDLKRSVCPNCKKTFCFKCNTLWHAGFSCEESGATRDANDVAFGILAERNAWKRCPRCRHYVQHSGDVGLTSAINVDLGDANAKYTLIVSI
ncbi:E3 ubiquitin-protein ligase RSL1-like [Impatiens glandulifera]|uniref:E3 ubiquitin-protein ligase RSL1-like n=1 Tax=Impatiens glandulifera TaxID=253017 RepID=UPI001FB0DE72|nr:E3 ubiquitin-protein ligase RSL1-like [Impatiens glandulifera]